MGEYPKRESHYAHKLVRLMVRTCAAQEIGPEGFALVVTIAHTEDSKRYTAPVTFWNHQLQTVLGMSWGRLDRARQKAEDAGWLHYERTANRSVGRYWTLCPPAYGSIPDGPCDCDAEEVFHQNSETNQDSFTILEKEPGNNQEITVKQTGNNREKAVNILSSSFPSSLPKKTRGFDDWWQIVHHKVGKEAARKAFESAKRRIRKDHPEEDPVEYLIGRMVAFSGTASANPMDRTPIHPATWLNQGRYDDDPKSWERRNGDSPAKSRSDDDDPGFTRTDL